MIKSRTKNVSRNMLVALICQFASLILNFVSRTVFVKTLGIDYLGVNGLFTNVLTVLSFAELGIGNAMIFSMYKPLAQEDTQKLASLMHLYKKAYQIIGTIVALVGLGVLPFLNVVIKDGSNVNESIEILYLLFLANSVVSYFFVYKKSIIIADQKNYIVLLLTEGIHIIQIIIQIVFLLITRNYIVFLLIQIGCTFLGNIIASIVANKLYPFLKGKPKELDKVERKHIFKNVRALAVYKFGSVVLNGTDNILVSSLVGVTSVGLVSNYVLLNTACNSILGKVTEGFTASVGNLNAVADSQKQYDIFKKIFFITAWLYGFVTVALIVLGHKFVSLWIGPEYLVDSLTAIAIVLGFYVQGVHFAAYTYRTTLGLFTQAQITPLLAAIFNIVLSIILCNKIGLAGIFIATPISRLITTGTIDPILIYKKVFRKNPLKYYSIYAGYMILFSGIAIICNYLCGLVALAGWLGLILQAVIVLFVFNILMLLIFGSNKMFREILRSGLMLFHKKNNDKSENKCI